MHPIIDQTGTYVYNTSKVVAKYLWPLSKNKYSIDDTLTFPDLLKNAEETNDYEDVSYDVENLFTSIPVKETIDYIIQKIYVRKEIKPFCKKSIFIKLLKKLTQECVFTINNRLIKQVDGCPMGRSISVVFSDIYVCKMEEDIVIPANPIFYKRYVDDTDVRRKKCETYKLFIDLNSYHENIKLTLEINSNKFLDTEIIRTSHGIKTQVYNQAKKLLVDWSSKVPYKYKRNAITGELHRAKRIASNFDNETKRIRNKYRDTGYPKHVIENTIQNFNSKKDELLIPPWLFDERKHVTIRLPFSSKNEKYGVYFINKLVSFTGEKVKFNVVWNARKIQSLFPLKDKVQHLGSVIYKGVCACGETYVGETIRNCKIRYDEHNDINKNSEPAKNLARNIEHECSWFILARVPANTFKRRILEAYFMKIIAPSLNEQLDNDVLMLFRNGVTWRYKF